MSSIIIAYTKLVLVVLGVQGVVASGSLYSDTFEKFPCSDPQCAMVLRGASIDETSQTSALRCAVSCGKNVQCNFAVFRQSQNLCKHVSDCSVMLPANNHSEEAGCHVLRKNESPLCDETDSNNCDFGYQGDDCRERMGFSFCHIGSWSQALPHQMIAYLDKRRNMKLSININNIMLVYDALYFKVEDDYTFLAGNRGILSVDTAQESFENPLRREFQFCSTTMNKLKTLYMSMSQEETFDESQETPICKLWIRDHEDPDPLLYPKDAVDPPTALIDGILNKGYRVFDTDVIRVGVDAAEGDVYYQQNKVRTSHDGFIAPAAMKTKKFCLKNKRVFTTKKTLTGDHEKIIKDTISVDWELDRCWATPPNDFTSVQLKDFVVRGSEIRVILHSSNTRAVSSDINVITYYGDEIVAALADYRTPFDGITPLDETALVRFTLLSLSKTSVCEMDDQLDTVRSLTTTENPTGTVEWVVSTRPWSKVFTTKPNGVILYGGAANVVNAATKMHGIRVCVIFDASRTLCSGSAGLVIKEGHVMLQTPASMEPSFDASGHYASPLNANCGRFVRLMNTKGFVEKAIFVLNKEVLSTVESEAFESMTWFSQE